MLSRQQVAYQTTIMFMATVGTARENTINLIDDELSNLEWTVLAIMSATMLFALLMINTGSITSILLISAAAISTVILLILLHALDTLQWKEATHIFEPYQRTFERMGLLRYYPDSLLQEKRVMLPTGSYRVGIFPHPYPDLRDKRIEVMKR
jgi:hypothetical protein